MKSVLIIVTSNSRRDGFLLKTYNEQEIGLAKALSKKGWICGIAYYGGRLEKEEVVDIGGYKVKMYLLKGHDLLKTAFFKDYSYIFNQYNILLPITYDHYESYRIAMKYPSKTIVYHGTYYTAFNKPYNLKCKIIDPLYLPGYRKMNTLFVTKNRLAAEFLNKKGLSNTHIIGVGFDSEQMACQKMLDSDFAQQIDSYKKDGYKIILYVGRIERRRNTLFLLETFSNVTKTKKAKLVIIGNGKDEYKEKCRTLIKKLGIQNSVIYKERMEQIYLPKIYKLSDLFLLPTSYEIFGMVILEAMYFGVPVLTTMNGGSDILIENEKSGYVIPELDIDKWALECVKILSQDNSSLITLAHNTIVMHFTWDVLADKFIECFKLKLNEE